MYVSTNAHTSVRAAVYTLSYHIHSFHFMLFSANTLKITSIYKILVQGVTVDCGSNKAELICSLNGRKKKDGNRGKERGVGLVRYWEFRAPGDARTAARQSTSL